MMFAKRRLFAHYFKICSYDYF